MGKFYDEDKDCMVGAHEFLSKDNRIKLTEAGKTSEIGYAQRMALRIGMEALSNNPNIRITNEMVEMRWLDLFGSTKDEANWAYDELRENLKIIFDFIIPKLKKYEIPFHNLLTFSEFLLKFYDHHLIKLVYYIHYIFHSFFLLLLYPYFP